MRIIRKSIPRDSNWHMTRPNHQELKISQMILIYSKVREPMKQNANSTQATIYLVTAEFQVPRIMSGIT